MTIAPYFYCCTIFGESKLRDTILCQENMFIEICVSGTANIHPCAIEDERKAAILFMRNWQGFRDNVFT